MIASSVKASKLEGAFRDRGTFYSHVYDEYDNDVVVSLHHYTDI